MVAVLMLEPGEGTAAENVQIPISNDTDSSPVIGLNSFDHSFNEYM